jgi:hypothetical protein
MPGPRSRGCWRGSAWSRRLRSHGPPPPFLIALAPNSPGADEGMCTIANFRSMREASCRQPSSARDCPWNWTGRAVDLLNAIYW